MSIQGRFAAVAAWGLLLSIPLPPAVFGQTELPVMPAAPIPVVDENDRTLEKSDRLEETANRHLAKGNLDAALTDFRQSRKLRASVIGDEHWVIRTAALTIDELTRIQKLPAPQRKAATDVIQTWKKSLQSQTEEETPEHAREMVACCTRVCELLGPKSPLGLEARVQIAQAQVPLKDFQAVKAAARESAAQTKNLIGENHPWYAFSLSLQATAHGELGEWDDARKIAGQALRANEHLWGEDTPPCGLNYLTLAWIDINRKNYEAARRHADNALHALAPEQEHDPANFALAQARLAHALAELGNESEAREKYVTLVEFVDKNERVPDDLQQEVSEKYAALLRKLGRVEEARAFEDRKETLIR